MGLFDRLFKKEEPIIEVQTEPGVLYLPIEGEVISLADIGDGVFSAEILGPGCGLRPMGETVYAPADGTVTTVAETLHAVGLQTKDGAEVLIHVGMDTVEMKGVGFEVLVEEGQSVRCGQPLLKFSRDKIKAAGHPTTTAFVVTNADELSEVTLLQTGAQKLLTAVMRAK